MNPEMNQHQEEEPNSSSGLLRFRSVPSRLASQSLFEEDFEESKPLANGFNSLNSQLQLPPQYPRQSSATQLAAMDSGGSFRVTGSAVSSSLMRQSSSPPGLFSHLPAQNGYGTISGFGNYKARSGSNGDTSLSLNRLRGLMNFSAGLSSSLGTFSQISEIEPESADGSCREDIKLGYGSRDPLFYSGYALGSWNEPSHFQESFSIPKRDIDINGKLFAGTQNRELENHRTHILSHHLSLPKSSAEMAAVDKLLQFQDTVPCKVRAKRGCATHPRSIAERVRRTKISERMRKLQELVPNMDKQTNTAEMLDLAVEYIKDLQKQYKALSENRASCKCSSMQKPLRNLPPA